MTKSGMNGTRIYIIREPQLLYSTQSLKIGMLDDIKNECIGYVYKTINRIIKYFLFIQSIFESIIV